MTSESNYDASARIGSIPRPSEAMVSPLQDLEREHLVSFEDAIKPLKDILRTANIKVKTPNLDSNAKYFQSKYRLSRDESLSILLYKLNGEANELSFGTLLNRTLSDMDRDNLKLWRSYLRLFTSALSKLSKTTELLYNGENKDLSRVFVKDKIFTWWSFMSCTSSYHNIGKYVGETGPRTIFSIKCQNGIDISQRGENSCEDEILVYPGRKFKVVSVNSTDNDIFMVHVEEIPQLNNPSQIQNSLSTYSPAGSIETASTIVLPAFADSSASIGSLYDPFKNMVVKCSTNTDIPTEINKIKSSTCEIIKCSRDRMENVWKMTGIRNDMRLNRLFDERTEEELAAVLDYSYPIHEYTRIFSYSYCYGETNLILDSANKMYSIKNSELSRDVTHVITGIRTGFDIIAILQLNYDDDIVQLVDRTLNRMRDILLNDSHNLPMSPEHRIILEKITHTKIYWNIKSVKCPKTIADVCDFIFKRKSSTSTNPTRFILQPIQTLYPSYNGHKLVTVSSELQDIVEQYASRLKYNIQTIESFKKYELSQLDPSCSREDVDRLIRQCSNTHEEYKKQVKALQRVIYQLQRGDISSTDARQRVGVNEFNTLNDKTRRLIRALHDLKEKQEFINSLKRMGAEHVDVAQYCNDASHNENSMATKLLQTYPHDRILCSSDKLRTNDSRKFEKMLNTFAAMENHNAKKSRLIYADFSNCHFELSKLLILPSKNHTNEHKKSAESKGNSNSSYPSTSNKDVINILLLGESGVGKSTFINAFANYLKFDSLEKAESGKSVVIIPVSFLITCGYNFEEKFIKFGEPDALNNEDFDHPGQSVTQACRSYLLNIGSHDKQMLRIIDTPGFADTRGEEQDKLNMQCILKYIKNLTHLNAICFLLNSTKPQLHGYLNRCILDILKFIGDDAKQCIIFCFTNSRSTFYSPGDVTPLLKKMLESLSLHKYAFQKQNTFCFDNESFRYLVARQNDIEFESTERAEYRKSWQKSVVESNRLLEYVSQSKSCCQIETNAISSKQIEIKILSIIKPILETIRNKMRNSILCKSRSKQLIEFRPKAIDCPMMICSVSMGELRQVGEFKILFRSVSKAGNKCRQCMKSIDQHTFIDYVLDYESVRCTSDHNADMDEIIKKWHRRCAHFSIFLIDIVHSSMHDPFLLGIQEMIEEERLVCKNLGENELNTKLLENLSNFRLLYEQEVREIKLNKSIDIKSIVGENIDSILQHPDVRIQMEAIMTSQRNLFEKSEVIA